MRTPYRYVRGLSPVYRRLRRAVAGVRYAGDAVRCPVCDRGFSRWLGGRANGMCPYCWSSCRHRILALHLDAHLAARRGAATDVLLFAPDWGMANWLSRRPDVRLQTTDLSAPDVDFHCDITDMRAVPDGSFDLVLCSHVLEHVPDDRRAMRELHRVTRPGGTCVIQVPYARGQAHTEGDDAGLADAAERRRRFGQFDHCRLYGRDLAERLAGPGFTVTAQTWPATARPAESRRYGLWNDTMFLCRKRLAAAAGVARGGTEVLLAGESMPARAA